MSFLHQCQDNTAPSVFDGTSSLILFVPHDERRPYLVYVYVASAYPTYTCCSTAIPKVLLSWLALLLHWITLLLPSMPKLCWRSLLLNANGLYKTSVPCRKLNVTTRLLCIIADPLHSSSPTPLTLLDLFRYFSGGFMYLSYVGEVTKRYKGCGLGS